MMIDLDSVAAELYTAKNRVEELEEKLEFLSRALLVTVYWHPGHLPNPIPMTQCVLCKNWAPKPAPVEHANCCVMRDL